MEEINVPATVILFLIVGATVSLDVTGLTVAKVDELSKQGRSIKRWALTNSF